MLERLAPGLFVAAMFAVGIFAGKHIMGCAPSRAPTDANDAPPAEATSLSVRACSNLKHLGCPEGVNVACASILEHAQNERLRDFRPSCLAGAKSKEAARACGTVTCP